MKLKVTLVACADFALLFAAVAVAKTDNGAAAAAAKAATIACGTTRTIGVAAPITGPASSIGSQQLGWAQYYVRRWNAVKANAKQKIRIIQGDTQLGVDTAFVVRVAQSFALKPKLLGVVGTGKQPRSRRLHLRAQGRGARVCDGLGDTRLAHRRHHRRRQPAGVLLPDRAERQRPGPDGRELHPPEDQGVPRVHHRRPGDVLPRASADNVQGACGQRASTSPATRSARTDLGLLLD